MSDLPGNSHKQRQAKENTPEKKVTPVVRTSAVRRKKPVGRRFAETFFGGGDARSVWGFVFLDVLLPGAQEIFLDGLYTGMERMILGESRGRSRRGLHRRDSHTPYHRANKEDPRDRQLSRRARSSHNFDEVLLNSRAEAEEVLDGLYTLIEKYEVATVADMYDLADIQSNYQDSKWGWEDLRGARVVRTRGGGWLLDLPRPQALE